MIVDVNTRTWTSATQLGSAASDQLRQLDMEHWLRSDHGQEALQDSISCVDVAFVHGFRSQMLEAHVPNEYLAELVDSNPSTFVGIAGIDPLTSDALIEVERALELGLGGITISPSMQGVHPTHSAAMRVYEACEAKKMPVFISRPDIGLSRSVMEFDRPAAWDEVARSFPELRIVISSLGFPWVDETLALLQKHRNVFADLARMTKNPWATWNALLSAQALSDGASNVMERLLFASGWPAESPARAIETLYSLNTFSQGSHLPTIPRATIHSIIERDTLKALGIERAPGHSMNGHGSHASKTMQSNIDDAVTKATLD